MAVPDRQAELEAAILADPDDDEAYLVYADWLMSNGDPRGELIVTQHQLASTERGTRRSALTKRSAELLADHAGAFVGVLATAHVKWRWGFVRELQIDRPDLEDGETDALTPVLAHPSARFVTELSIGVFGAWRGNSIMQAYIDHLGALAVPAGLRRLTLAHAPTWSVSTGDQDFGDLLRAFPALRRITLRERTTRRPRATDVVHELTIRRKRGA